MPASHESDSLKKLAAVAAAGLVQEGMLVGLGTGSTAAYMVEELGRRVEAGLRIKGIPTSDATAERARSFGIPLVELSSGTHIHLTIDGADEVETSSLNLVKGRGGALLHEKIVAAASERLVIVADETKVVEHLGRGPLPVEVIPFGYPLVADKLRDLGAAPSLRVNAQNQPFKTDSGHYILDCLFKDSFDATQLQESLDRMVGVVDHGLFLGMTTHVYIGGASGLRILSANPS